MKCPKCSYVSHDYLNACRKCRVDLLRFKSQMQLHAVQAGTVDLRSALSGVQSSSVMSGEYGPDDFIISPSLEVGRQSEADFDINLEDDFSFTPSSMSLESLDGFEIGDLKAMDQEHPSSSQADNSGASAPETGYATVMMDISSLSDEAPPSESDHDMLDISTDVTGPTTDAPFESEEASVEPPALTADDSITAPEITLDEPCSTDNEEVPWSNPEPMTPNFDHSDVSETIEDESGSSPLPPLEAHFVTTEDTSPVAGASDASETSTSFTMPILPDPGTDEESVEWPSEEDSLDMDTMVAPEPPPIEFPSFQSVITPIPESDATTTLHEASQAEPTPLQTDEPQPPLSVEPTVEPGASALPKSRHSTYELDINDIRTPDDTNWSELSESAEEQLPSPHEATIVDEPSPFASSEQSPTDVSGASTAPRNHTYELDFSDTQQSDETAWPNLPEPTDALIPTSPNDATIVDVPSPFSATSSPPSDSSIMPPTTAPAEIDEIDDELDLKSLFPDEQPPKKRD